MGTKCMSDRSSNPRRLRPSFTARHMTDILDACMDSGDPRNKAIHTKLQDEPNTINCRRHPIQETVTYIQMQPLYSIHCLSWASQIQAIPGVTTVTAFSPAAEILARAAGGASGRPWQTRSSSARGSLRPICSCLGPEGWLERGRP